MRNTVGRNPNALQLFACHYLSVNGSKIFCLHSNGQTSEYHDLAEYDIL